jgi:inosine/xanthosine triphosphate pyrophosphatase family protein
VEAPRGSGGSATTRFPARRRDRTSAEVDQATKDAASHRGQAFRALGPAIETWAGAVAG